MNTDSKGELLPPAERPVPEQWLTLTYTTLLTIHGSIRTKQFPVPDDWIEWRLKQLKAIRLINPDNPLTK